MHHIRVYVWMESVFVYMFRGHMPCNALLRKCVYVVHVYVRGCVVDAELGTKDKEKQQILSALLWALSVRQLAEGDGVC